MADTPIPIDDLAEVTAGGSDYIPISQLGNTRKAKISSLPPSDATLAAAAYTPFATPTDAGGADKKKIEILSGVLRQDPTNKSKWVFLEDSGHTSAGFNTVFNSGAGSLKNLHAVAGALTVRYAKAYKKVLSVSVVPDETLATSYRLTSGASAGLESIQIWCGFSKALAGLIYWDGTQWVTSNGTYQGSAPAVSYNSTSGLLTVTHYNGTTKLDLCPGVDVQLTGYYRSSIIPYLPVILSIANGSFGVVFVDPATGNVLTGAPSTKMAINWRKAITCPVNLDGTSGFDQIPFSSTGNLWVTAVLEAF